MTLRDALDTRDNALNLVRLALAGLVIVAHTWLVGGFPATAFTNSLGMWAVHGFFAISGYLIASSRLRTGFRSFVLRRAVRILPGFWICLLVTALVVAPLVALLLGTTYDLASAWAFVRGNWWLWLARPSVGHSLSGASFPSTINGSLWTLAYEFGAYIVAGLLLDMEMFRESRRGTKVLVLVGLLGPQACAGCCGWPAGRCQQWLPVWG